MAGMAEDTLHPAWAEIDIAALQHNFGAVCARVILVAAHSDARNLVIAGFYELSKAMVTGGVSLGISHGMRPVRSEARYAHSLLRERPVPILGVSSEHCSLDLSAVPSAGVGEPVTFVGDSAGRKIPLGQRAQWQGCIPLDSAMSFSGRIRRQLMELA